MQRGSSLTVGILLCLSTLVLGRVAFAGPLTFDIREGNLVGILGYELRQSWDDDSSGDWRKSEQHLKSGDILTSYAKSLVVTSLTDPTKELDGRLRLTYVMQDGQQVLSCVNLILSRASKPEFVSTLELAKTLSGSSNWHSEGEATEYSRDDNDNLLSILYDNSETYGDYVSLMLSIQEYRDALKKEADLTKSYAADAEFVYRLFNGKCRNHYIYEIDSAMARLNFTIIDEGMEQNQHGLQPYHEWQGTYSYHDRDFDVRVKLAYGRGDWYFWRVLVDGQAWNNDE